MVRMRCSEGLEGLEGFVGRQGRQARQARQDRYCTVHEQMSTVGRQPRASVQTSYLFRTSICRCFELPTLRGTTVQEGQYYSTLQYEHTHQRLGYSVKQRLHPAKERYEHRNAQRLTDDDELKPTTKLKPISSCI